MNGVKVSRIPYIWPIFILFNWNYFLSPQSWMFQHSLSHIWVNVNQEFLPSFLRVQWKYTSKWMDVRRCRFCSVCSNCGSASTLTWRTSEFVESKEDTVETLTISYFEQIFKFSLCFQLLSVYLDCMSYSCSCFACLCGFDWCSLFLTIILQCCYTLPCFSHYRYLRSVCVSRVWSGQTLVNLFSISTQLLETRTRITRATLTEQSAIGRIN